MDQFDFHIQMKMKKKITFQKCTFSFESHSNGYFISEMLLKLFMQVELNQIE